MNRAVVFLVPNLIEVEQDRFCRAPDVNNRKDAGRCCLLEPQAAASRFAYKRIFRNSVLEAGPPPVE